MASADNEVDPSVNAVGGKEVDPSVNAVGGDGSSRTASPTPPPPASQSRSPRRAAQGNLSDRLAGMVANGEELPGIDDEDALLQGEEREHDLDTMAIAAATHRRQKQKATQKKADTDSDSDLPDSKRSKESGGKGRDSAGGKGRESRDSAGGKGRDSARGKGRDSAGGNGSARKGKRPREDVDLVSDDDMDQTVVSRHTPVGVSQIYKDWQGSLLDDVRRRFQTLMFARDGYPLKTLSTHKKLNYKLAIRAANQIMSTKDYTAFQTQMDRAFRDSERS